MEGKVEERAMRRITGGAEAINIALDHAGEVDETMVEDGIKMRGRHRAEGMIGRVTVGDVGHTRGMTEKTAIFASRPSKAI